MGASKNHFQKCCNLKNKVPYAAKYGYANGMWSKKLVKNKAMVDFFTVMLQFAGFCIQPIQNVGL